MSKHVMKISAAAAAAVIVAFGAYALGSGGSGGSTGSANASAFGGPGQAGPNGQSGAQGQGWPQGPAGQYDATGQQGVPPGGGPGFGRPVTGTAAKKASAAARARYPGTVERVMQLTDGSYVVHVITSSGEQHVLVSKAFKVTGVEQRPQGGPPAGGMPGAPGGPQQGSQQQVVPQQQGSTGTNS